MLSSWRVMLLSPRDCTCRHFIEEILYLVHSVVSVVVMRMSCIGQVLRLKKSVILNRHELTEIKKRKAEGSFYLNSTMYSALLLTYTLYTGGR